MTDIEISRNSKKLHIYDIGKKIGLKKNDLELYGNYKAKIKNINPRKKQGKLILVTAISPTPMGEGKTTVSIGLGDALQKIGEKVVIALREPSMGPVFGMKGGATGGGYSQVVPMEDINLHFTGDFHAITSANNLISAAIDNHIYFGNSLDIQKVFFKRCLDVNDRALRDVDLGTRRDSFTITSASEIMALFCLATSLDDLRKRLGNIIVGVNSKGEYIYVRDLNIEGSLVALLKDAFQPNLVQTVENTPTLIHGGPFANIAHGCNSLMATKTALSYANYVVTEAGFGADLGAEKFLNIKCRIGNLKPHAVVLVATIKGMKYHGGVPKDKIFDKNDEALKKGFENLDKHYENLKKFGVNVVVCLNKFNTDTDSEIELVKKHCEEMGYIFTVSSAYSDGGSGAVDLAHKVIDLPKAKFKVLYKLEEPVEKKIKKICKEIYGAGKVTFSPLAKEKIHIIEENGLANLPVCIAKTQYSFSDDKDKVGVPKDFEVTVRDVNLYNGAGFITALLGDIMTMPGLSRKPNCELIDVVDGEIVNLS
ncbi:MAG: formate--tetrahydrofolate ligase [Bacilli bacterium]|nr:formate--tetrahydrofolate ligase [Bacilli bacterium]